MESANCGLENLYSKQVPGLEQSTRGGLSAWSQHFQTGAAGLTMDIERCLERRKATTESSAAQSAVRGPAPAGLSWSKHRNGEKVFRKLYGNLTNGSCLLSNKNWGKFMFCMPLLFCFTFLIILFYPIYKSVGLQQVRKLRERVLRRSLLWTGGEVNDTASETEPWLFTKTMIEAISTIL